MAAERVSRRQASPARGGCMSTMPGATLKGKLSNTGNPLDATSYTIVMSGGTTGTALATNDFVFMYVTSGGPDSTSNTPVKPSSFTTLVAWQAMGTSTTSMWALWVKKREAGDSDYVITQSNVSRSNRVNILTFWLDGANAKDIPDWIIGTQGTRAGSGGTFSTNAPAVTTLIDNTMVFGFGTERTSASEVDANLTVSGTGWTKQGSLLTPTATLGTLTVASKPMTTPGSSGVVTFTSTNTQTTNGAAFQIAIPAGVVVTPGYPGSLYTGSAVISGQWYVKGASDILPATWAGMVHPGYSSITAMLAKPFFYASHRGGSRNWPEQSLQGYTQSAIRGYGALEISLARSSDGVWFGLHDASLDRTSLGTGGGSGTTYVASAMTWSAIQTHDMLPAVGSPVNSTHQPYATLDSILDAYLKSHVLFIDVKSASTFRVELISILKNRPEWQDKIVAKSVPGNSNNSFLALARTEGFATNAMFYEEDTFTTYHTQADILGMELGASGPTWTSILGLGKPVMAHVLNNAAAIISAQSLGADGAMVSGPVQAPLVTM
jgi:glycerophosphoryl diester phosphodiesterase family protein